jgi:hypothetical protein
MTRATRVSAQCMLAQLRILYVEAMFEKCGWGVVACMYF